MKDLPIGVFDSGLGGISVLGELVRQLPGEDFIYFGDSANAPYGSRCTEEIRQLTTDCAERLFTQGIKALVIACNTATSAAAEDLRKAHPEQIIIGIEPALKPAVRRFPGGKILVMATDATLREQKFASLLEQYDKDCEIHKCPCPELVAFVERGELDSDSLHEVLLRELAGHLDPLPDAVVLGCTHFPFLKTAISKVVGHRCLLMDGSSGTARETRRRLQEANLLACKQKGTVTFLNSLDNRQIPLLAKGLFEQITELASL
ncbi:MAG: glutamate racemase [Oscillospiraceae bacterium]|nr:glutamate racemase [Oscillospiraceae bacterium]